MCLPPLFLTSETQLNTRKGSWMADYGGASTILNCQRPDPQPDASPHLPIGPLAQFRLPTPGSSVSTLPSMPQILCHGVLSVASNSSLSRCEHVTPLSRDASPVSTRSHSCPPAAPHAGSRTRFHKPPVNLLPPSTCDRPEGGRCAPLV